MHIGTAEHHSPLKTVRKAARNAARSTARGAALPLLVVAVAVCLATDISLGPVTVPVIDVLRTVVSPLTGADSADIPNSAVVTSIRMPRAATAALVGAALAVAGAVMQAVFRNPLADPGVIGVSSGAATTAVLAIVTGLTATNRWVLPAAAFLGALVTVILVQAVATLRGGGPATLVLVGVAVSAFLGAVTSSAVANAPQDSDIRGVSFWLNGDLVARTWQHAGLAAVPVVLCLVVLAVLSRDLNILVMGDAAARSTGVDVRVVRAVLLLVASLLTASAVAVSGIIGFVGLVVPHLVRIVLGPDHRILLPAAALTGACFVLLADTVARMLFSPVVLQTGSVVAFLGSPVFLWLLLTTRSTRRFTP